MAVAYEARSHSWLVDVLALCRPQQCVKNVFVLAPLLFGGALLQWESWLAEIAAVSCFCLLSCAVYCWNDVVDATADREHPRKRLRPVAAGRVTPALALGLSLTLVSLAGLLACYSLPTRFQLLAALYLMNSLVYCSFAKHRVIIDVLAIAVGFVLRLMAGCAAIQVEPTSWMLVCGFSLALLLGFGKRQLEIGVLGEPAQYRPVLQSYSPQKINLLLGVSSAMCLLSYMLYTTSPTTVQLHHTDKLVYSVPFVAYGVFRYLFKVQEGRHDGPVEVLLTDPAFTLNGLAWIVVVAAILYLPQY